MPKLRHTKNTKYIHLKINYETFTMMKKWRVRKKFAQYKAHIFILVTEINLKYFFFCVFFNNSLILSVRYKM